MPPMATALFSVVVRVGTSLVLVACLSCARTPRAQFVPLAAPQAALMLPLPRSSGAEVQGFVADGRLTSLGHDGRLRAPLRLLVQRPDRLRLSVLAPQGAAALVLASDGATLTSLDVRRGQFRQVPADRAGLRALAPELDFGLTPQMLASLLFGEVTPPNHAALSANVEALRFCWDEEGTSWRADFARDSGRLLRLAGERGVTAGKDPQQQSAAALPPMARVRAEVQRWGAEGLPTRLLLEAWPEPSGKSRAPAQTLELDLDRIDVEPSVRDGAFVVHP